MFVIYILHGPYIFSSYFQIPKVQNLLIRIEKKN